jgi:hypothetical protein
MTNELDRLLTITDLSEVFGVPVDTLFGWRHRGEARQATESAVMFDTAEQPLRLGSTPRSTSPEVTWRTLSGVAFASATPPDEPVPCALQGALPRRLGEAPQRDQDQIG